MTAIEIEIEKDSPRRRSPSGIGRSLLKAVNTAATATLPVSSWPESITKPHKTD